MNNKFCSTDSLKSDACNVSESEHICVGPADETYVHDIDSSLKRHIVKKPTLVGPEDDEDDKDDDNSFGGHVPVGDGDDDDACSPPRNVFQFLLIASIRNL